MALQSLSSLLSAAEAGGYAVGSFNVSDLNQACAVLEAASDQASPVIVQAIAGLHPYASESWWWDQLLSLAASFVDVPVTLHLDHGRTLEDCRRAVEHGFTSVMIDASRDVGDDSPTSLEHNIDITREAVAIAHPHGVSVEGELGTIGGAELGTAADTEEIVFADPESAEHFVRETGVDALAVAVGTSHGSVKFTTEKGGQKLRIPLIAEIKARIPSTFLVLHGSSSIPADAVELINANGGRVEPSYGISTDQKREAITHGIRKINQGTDSHLAWTSGLRRCLTERPEAVDPSIAIAAGMDSMRAIVALRMREFGSAGMAR